MVKRKSGFFRTLLPLVMLANHRISIDRARILSLQESLESSNELDESDHAWLHELASRYSIDADRMSDPAGTIGALLPRVDAVPPSLALAQAAIESGWGRSRFALEGNALFGQWTWDGNGIKPLEAADGSTHQIARFDNLLDSVEAYMLNLNSQGAYSDFRKIRAAQRAQGHSPDGLTLASALVHYSQEGTAYPAKLDTIIRANKLSAFDQAVLDIEGAGLVIATP
jgi:Bax protein